MPAIAVAGRLYLQLSGNSAPGSRVSRGPDTLRYTVRFMSYVFRHSTCNEAFDKWPFADACKTIRKAGYDGIEIAPFTLAEDPVTLSAAARREARDAIASEDLQFVGLHWLMVSPKGLHVTTPDTTLRNR